MTTEMILTKQYIQDHIKDNNIDTTKPFKLDLSYNKLTSIEKGTFDGLDKLTSLNLYGNNMTSIVNQYYGSREEILELIEKLNSLDSEVDNVDCLVDGNTTLNDIKDKIDKYRKQIIQEIINFLSK